MIGEKHIYNPIEFVERIEVITITVFGSFATWRLLNIIYDNIYEPVIDGIIDTNATDKYYAKIGHHYVPAGLIMKEFIKWIIIIILLMLLYNMMRWYNASPS